ncbi:MAG TPA: trypsin-like peptidase domain-containing protein [Thermoanaerobaculia bacterium]|jgi:V8-like Glu-specific endopeptidase|nr:trypsin-like peptidase domain-containing protein [Thermoanaerobaculia bacterium]
MPRSRSAVRIVALIAATLAWPGSAVIRAQGAIKIGEELPYRAATPADYPAGGPDRPVTWSETIVSPGATFLRVHFSEFDLPAGDYLTLASPDGTEVWTYRDRGPRGTGEFWTFLVESDTAVVELHSGSSSKGREGRHGVTIDRIAYGTAPLNGESSPLIKAICGTDGRENVACHPEVNVRPVALVTFQRAGWTLLCTGWLVAGSNPNTMMTNSHCFSNQEGVDTVEAKFNYQTKRCAPSSIAATRSYAGRTFLKTSPVSKLDYTLFTLAGNPEATWGEYTATRKSPTVGMAVNFPQHSKGRVKQIAYWQDAAHTRRCTVATVNATYEDTAPASQMGFGCDSEVGSSGSPILDAATGRVIGINHLGDVAGACLNAATQMKNICAHAGALLSCAAGPPNAKQGSEFDDASWAVPGTAGVSPAF